MPEEEEDELAIADADASIELLKDAKRAIELLIEAMNSVCSIDEAEFATMKSSTRLVFKNS